MVYLNTNFHAFKVRFTIPEEIEGTTRSLPQYDFSRVIAFFVRFAIPEETEGSTPSVPKRESLFSI